MDSHTSPQDRLLRRGPRTPQLPPPDERRRLRELWGADIEELADALNLEPETMAAWEAGQYDAEPADTYAYLRLLNAFRAQLPTAYEPDWAALRNPPTAPIVPAQVPTARREAKPARRGARWTQEERDCLRARYGDGASDSELAASLGRSEKAVRWELYHLKLVPFPADHVPVPRPPEPQKPKAYTVEDKRKTHSNAYTPWSTDEEQRLAERCEEGVSLAELSQEFGRGAGGIASRLLKIGAHGPAAEEARELRDESHRPTS